MVLFPVMPWRGSGLWNALQFWEFAALMELTRASSRRGLPVLANGACLAISRKEALNVRTWHPGSASSGDDLALLQYCRRQGLPVVFAEMPGPAVRFRAAESGPAMISQRLRWTSKLGAYPDGSLYFSAGIIGLANLSVVLWAIVWLSGWTSASLLIPAMKFGTDLLVVAGSTRIKGKGAPWIWLPVALLVYPVYGSFIACASFWSRPEWKGRKVKLSNAA
jgi:cellulose synthase/poly-beta-1,6-N-acetylglucosamine synthase-like glycosyltransferase